MFYGFNSRMLPDEVHPKPQYRRLAPRCEAELAMIQRMQRKRAGKKRKSQSADVSKSKPDSLQKIDVDDLGKTECVVESDELEEVTEHEINQINLMLS